MKDIDKLIDEVFNSGRSVLRKSGTLKYELAKSQLLQAFADMGIKYQQAENRLGDAVERIEIYNQQISDLKAENEALKNCVNCKIEGGFFDTTKAECMSCKNYSHWQRRAL